MSIFKPEVFQGSVSKKNYFEGWYFKNISVNQEEVYSFIPGISLSENDPHCFIQIIIGITGETHYISYSLDQFEFKKDQLFVKVGNSIFTENYIDLDINTENINVKGRLNYSGLSRYPNKFLAPGIMGWYTFVPFMECYHGVVSVNHSVNGILQINGKSLDFNGGKGYIEKDWGKSFPECWIWLQANNFQNENASVFFSVAKIPWIGKFFIGFIAFIYLEGKYYQFSTYNKSKLNGIDRSGSNLNISLSNKNFNLQLNIESRNAGELIAPVGGNMTRRIKESIDSEVKVVLRDKKNEIVFEDQSKRTGLEVIEKIFEYL